MKDLLFHYFCYWKGMGS